MRPGKWAGRASFLAALLASGVGLAQRQPEVLPTFELERLELNPGAGGSLLLGTGELLPSGGLRASITGHYERNPLALYRDGRVSAVVTDRATAHLAVAYAPTTWLQLGAQIPMVLLQQGEDLSGEGIFPPARSGLGTPRVDARVGLLSERAGGGLDLAVELGMGLNVGSSAALARDGALRYQPRVMLGRNLGAIRAGLEAGVLLRPGVVLTPDAETVRDELGSEVRGGLSLSTTGDGLRGELDLRGALSLARHPNAMEVLAGVRLPVGIVELYALGGVGFGSAPGTPLYRVLAGVAFGPGRPAPEPAPAPRCVEGQPHDVTECPDLDADQDEVRNAADKCPTEPGPASREGCPTVVIVRDSDQDGVEDGKDKCPTQAGVEEHEGCSTSSEAALAGPLDTDQDGIFDPKDACPDQAGPIELKGCPPKDADKDGVADHLDNCPKQAGTVENQGCPKTDKQLVTLAREKLEIKGKVYFDAERATIQKRSLRLLDQVARVLNEHPEIPTVQIEGHTDKKGPPGENLKLSRERAEAVRRYLIQRGVEPSRLVARGFGETRPVDTNRTRKGRERNRRVEFIITTERTETVEVTKP